ncbi:MAG: glutamate racemase [Anaerolineales bacterium]|nr:glutamate racemase [Anaerolineales bacterium]MBX3005788.1 glutamate racemase [Anaerolineales bacterium]
MNSPHRTSPQPIGAFDSGVGGLSVLRALQAELPGEDFIYFADQAHVPYGPRGLEQVRGFSEAIARYLVAQGAKLIVIPCNTASAAALHSIRQRYPQIPVVGMEPAVKPAAEHTASGVVGVLATETTFEGELYASVVERFAQDVTVLQNTCRGLVSEIEAGRANGPEARRILSEALQPMLAQGMDTVVLGCTHYPFAFDTIRDIVGPAVRLVDPAPAVARRVHSLLAAGGLAAAGGEGSTREHGTTRYVTSGDSGAMQQRVHELLGVEAVVEGVYWQNGEIHPQMNTDEHR